MPDGRICKGLNGLYEVHAHGGVVMCRAASRIRKEDGIKLLVGDIAVFSDNGDGTGFINGIRERKNSFVRPQVANADVIAIVASGVNPDPLLYNIDKMCCIAEAKGTDVMLVFSKSDLGGTNRLAEIYRHTPYRCFEVGVGDTDSLDEIKDAMRGRFTVLTGASGVGKSSLINLLFPKVNADTGELSRIGRGKNTTRATEIFELDGCYIADTPGFSMLDYARCTETTSKQLITLFPETLPFLGSCRYTKCSHTKEEGCAVISAVREGIIAYSRHQSYVQLYAEAKSASRY